MLFTARTAWIAFASCLLPAASVGASLADPPPPPVLSPKSGDVWTVGEVVTVKWSTDGIPFFEGDNKTPFPGTVYLGHLTDSDAGFTLWSQEPLADNVPLLNREVQVVVPDVPSGSNYFIMLNKPTNQGGIFTIKNPKDPKGTGAAPSSLSVSTLPVTTASFILPSTLSASASATSASVSGNSSSSAPAVTLSSTFGVGASATTSTTPLSDATASASISSTTSGASATATSDESASSRGSGTGAPSSSPTPNGGIRLQEALGGLMLSISVIISVSMI